MTPPGWIKLGPILYELVLDPTLHYRRDRAGTIAYREERIYIDPSFPTATQLATLLHEIQHGTFNNCGTEAMRDDEDLVDRCALAWMTTLLESPGLLEYLIAVRDGDTE